MEPSVSLRRKELAEFFGCVPSQINYVLRSRFTPERGFLVESQRGGHGYIRILRVIGSSFIISWMITMNNPLLQLIYDGVVAIIVPLFIIWLVYRNANEYIYFKKLFAKILKKLVKRHA